MVALLTARELAEALHVSTETILRWSRRGQLPALKLPSGAIRFRPCELEEWLAARELQKDDEAADGNGDLVKNADAGGDHGKV